MTQKHTPRPWAWLDHNNPEARYSELIVSITNEDHGGETILNVDGYVIEPYRALIAAAPDLLEALKELLDDYECHEDNAYCALGIEHGIRLKAKAAIAKAEGR